MGDNEDFFFGTDNDINMYWDGTLFVIEGSANDMTIDLSTAGVAKISGGTGAGDYLQLQCNSTVAVCRLSLDVSDCYLIHGAGGSFFIYDSTAGNYLKLHYSNPDGIIENTVDAKNIYLKPTGAGLVKFGTSVGTGDVVCNGYVTILDDAGNSCKLMRCA
jgi:hypothetical protein